MDHTEEEEEGWMFGGWMGEDDDNDDDIFGVMMADSGEEVSSLDSPKNLTKEDEIGEIVRQLRALHLQMGNTSQQTMAKRIVEGSMGSMALCRGKRGEMLREAGALNELLLILLRLFPESCGDSAESCALCIACWGAVRDLCCGSAGNRNAVRRFCENGVSGIELQALYLKEYHGTCWEQLDARHTRLLTTVIGVMRNVSHSTSENCQALHDHGVSTMLVWRLGSLEHVVGSFVKLPDPSKPWREASFRAAGTLINMAEKCNDCAVAFGNNPSLIHILVESWGGNNKKLPLLHLGLAAILRAAKEQLVFGVYDPSWDEILEREEARKKAAQRREEARKQRQSTSADSYY